jgi:hypothetical protein
MVAGDCTREKAERKEQKIKKIKKTYHTRCGNANTTSFGCQRIVAKSYMANWAKNSG